MLPMRTYEGKMSFVQGHSTRFTLIREFKMLYLQIIHLICNIAALIAITTFVAFATKALRIYIKKQKES